jgi:hypothetical protein
MKPFDSITVQDLRASPVWEFVHEELTEGNSQFVQPVTDLPVSELALRVVGTEVVLQIGATRWAILGNICLRNLRSTEQFLTVSIEKDGEWFSLARYHDSDAARSGPLQLAGFLGLSVSDVFPISYDISSVAVGLPEVTCGKILAEPKERLSLQELIKLSLSTG